jgi:plastocyanin
MAVLFFGLVFSPLLVVAGLIMFMIAAVGWYRDAGSEFRQVEAGHAPEPVTRDPDRAFPRSVVRIYFAIGIVAVALVVLPGLVSGLSPKGGPGGSPGASGGPPGSGGPVAGELKIAAKNIAFNPTTLQAPAGKPFTIVFDNQEAAPHNVAIYDSPAKSKVLFAEPPVAGPKTVTYKVPALPAGSYPFVCQVHPNMTGTLDAR